MVSGLLKSYFMRIKLWFDPIFDASVRVLSLLNAIMSLVVVVLLIYGFGFRSAMDSAIILKLFKTTFFLFYIEHCIFFLTNLVNRRIPQYWLYSGSIFILMTFIMILWWLPQNTVDKYTFLRYACHDYTLLVVVGIQAVLKFSTMLTGLLSNRLSPNKIFVGSFLLLIIVGTGLLLLPRATRGEISLLDTFFTAVSSVCVTGLMVVDITSVFTLTGQIVILVLIQLGGIGIMTFTSFFGLMFAGRHSGQNKMLIKDLIDSEKNASQIFSTLRNILFLTFLIEGLGTWMIYTVMADYSWHGLYIALFHAVSAFCNAGISVIPDGLSNPALADNYALLHIISFLVIFGGLGFPILFNIWRWIKHTVDNLMRKLFGKRRNYVYTSRIITSNSAIVLFATLFLLTTATLLFFVTEYNNILADKSLWGKLSTAFFLAVTPRTAGFSVFNVDTLMPVTLIYMLILMWIGGSPMSTAGGIKTTTFGIAILNIWNTLRGRDHIEIRHRSLSHQTVNRAFIIIFVSLVVMAGGVFFLAVFEPHIPLKAVLVEVVAAFSTVGLSMGITPSLAWYSKVVIMFIMFVGRIGLLTLLACFIPESDAKFYNYPTENIPIN